MTLGEVIKTLRAKKGLSQTQLAEMCELSQAALSQIESGRTQPQSTTMKTIAEKLEIPPAIIYFLSINEEDFPEHRRKTFRTLERAIRALVLQLLEDED